MWIRTFFTRLIDNPEEYPDYLQSGLEEQHFRNETAIAVMRFIDQHYADYGVVPGRARRKSVPRDLSLADDAEEPLSYYIEQLFDRHRYYLLRGWFE